MSASPLVTHGHATEAASGALPSLALAPGRLLAYRARGDKSRAIAARVPEIVAELPVTPTVRQVYYILAGDMLIDKTEKAYKALVRQLGRMRKGGVLPYDAFIDGTRDRAPVRTFEEPSEALAYAAALYRRNLWATQPLVAEVWTEADTLSQMISQVTVPWGLRPIPTHGNPSLSLLYTSAAVFAQRWARGQRTRLIYVGDFDPAGMDMSDNLHTRLVEVGAPPEAFEVKRVALTQALIVAYRLPPHPPKKKDKRTPAFIAKYGVACVEVEALPPPALTEIVEEEIKACVMSEEPWYWEAQQERAEKRALRDFARLFGDEIDRQAREGWGLEEPR